MQKNSTLIYECVSQEKAREIPHTTTMWNILFRLQPENYNCIFRRKGCLFSLDTLSRQILGERIGKAYLWPF